MAENIKGTSEFVRVTLNDFRFNAGVLGLIKLLRYGKFKEGEDYIIKGQSLDVKKDILINRDIGTLYISALVDHFKDDTRFVKTMEKKGILDNLYLEPKIEDRDWQKKVSDIFKEFSEILSKGRATSAYDILAAYEEVAPPIKDMVEELKAEKDYMAKKEKYDKIYELCTQGKVKEVLTFRWLLDSHIKLIYATQRGQEKVFLKTDKKENDEKSENEKAPKKMLRPDVAYNQVFMEPLREFLKPIEEKNTINCISCGCKVGEKLKIETTLFADTADDLARKTSYYWDFKVDAYLCPLCAFICSLAPLGFHYIGADGIFINNSCDIDTLVSFDEAMELSSDDDKIGQKWCKLYNSFTNQKIQGLSKKVDNIQVVIRNSDKEKYIFSTIDKRTVNILSDCATELSYINIIVKDKEDYRNVYLEAVDNIVHKRKQYPLITEMLRVAIDKSSYTGYIYNLLKIQIISQAGGKKMAENNIKRAYVAKKYGEEMRSVMTQGIALPEDRDKKLRGLVYQMLNAVALGNRDKFIEMLIRIYSGANKPVPDIFLTCFAGDDEFKEIAFAYLLGLKSETIKKEEV